MSLVAENRDRGVDVEDVATERWPLDPVAEERDAWCDLEFVDDLEGSLAGVIAEVGTPAEVKSCVDELDGGRRAGRWWIAREAHEQLLEAGGVYVLTVVDRETERVLRMGLTDAETVDAIIDGTWYDCGAGGRTVDQYRQLSWTSVFDSLEAPNGGGDRG